MKKITLLFLVSIMIGCSSNSTTKNVKMREVSNNSSSSSINAAGIQTLNKQEANPTTNISANELSGVTGSETWCAIENITLKQIFLKPDSCDSCGHSFLVSDSQFTSANHDFVSDSVIGIDIDVDKKDGNGSQEMRMDDIAIFSNAYPYDENKKEAVFEGNSVKYTLPVGDGSNCSMVIILDFGTF